MKSFHFYLNKKCSLEAVFVFFFYREPANTKKKHREIEFQQQVDFNFFN